MALTVFVLIVVLAVFAEAFLPRRNQPAPEPAAYAPDPNDLSFVLRSGLAPIRGYAEILGDRISGEDRRMVMAIEHHADRLTHLADRLAADR